MYCLKCGKETADEAVFCERCLSVMAQYPVKPGAPVPLPRKDDESAAKKAPKKKAIPPEEQLAAVKRSSRRLTIAFLVMTLAFCISAGLLVYRIIQDSKAPDTTGYNTRNYTIDTTVRP